MHVPGRPGGTSSARFCFPLSSPHLASGSSPTQRPLCSNLSPEQGQGPGARGRGLSQVGREQTHPVSGLAPLAGLCAGPAATLGRPAVAAGDSAGGIWGHSSQLRTSGGLRALPHRCEEGRGPLCSLQGPPAPPCRVWDSGRQGFLTRAHPDFTGPGVGSSFPLKTSALGPRPGRGDCGARA